MRRVCTNCGRCWEMDGRTAVDSLVCPGCDQRVVCESRPTWLVATETSTHTLENGFHVLVRPLLYSDRRELAVGYQHLSQEAKRLRFFHEKPDLSDADVEYLTNLDYASHFAFAAFAVDEPGQPGIGVARYIVDAADPTRAEVAVTVLDDYQQRGVGALLFLLLLERARDHGVSTFVSYVLWDNTVALDACRDAGARIEREEPGVARAEFDLVPETEDTASIVRSVLRSFAQMGRDLWP